MPGRAVPAARKGQRDNSSDAGTQQAPSSSRLEPLSSVQDVSNFLRVPVQTLYSWRHQGIGPRAYRCGKHLRYAPAKVLRWLEDQGDRHGQR